MRFLIVDDDPNKISILRQFLAEQGIGNDDVVVAAHAAEARAQLDRAPVDVLLIDVLLPARRDARPSGETSVELVRQMLDDGTTPAPRYILGVTASLEAQTEYESDFRSLFSQILHVVAGEDSWRESLRVFLRLASRVGSAENTNDYDICVLNALRSPELEAVYSHWPTNLGAEHLVSRNILCRTGTLAVGGESKRIVCAHLSQMGPIASTHAATALLTGFRPRLLLMTGICGGFADHVKLGDVVVAEKSWDWQAGKWSDKRTLATSLDQRNGAAELVAAARTAEPRLREFHAAFTEKKPKDVPRLVVGPMVTGSSVVASLDIQKVFRDQHRKMVGVDMECYGLYYAADNHAAAPVLTICIKSVSDLADRAKKDKIQPYCSYMSSLVALEVIRTFFSR